MTLRPIIEQAAAAHGGVGNARNFPPARIKVKGTIEVQRQQAPYWGQSVYFMPDRVQKHGHADNSKRGSDD